MISNIQEHHSEEEIQKMSMENDSKLWRTQLEFYVSEIEFYLSLLRSSLIEKTKFNTVDANYLLKQFQDLREINEFHLETCIHYQWKLPQVEECDDVQCDHEFLKSHLLLKNKLEKHFDEIRNLKESAFTYLEIDNK
ncbi:hypothetical protein [Autumnicola musiva]|uniref:Uncharacterized protein n=1 Tax=Autumnicola musiva TaxID=3075589 RepID=A0ABU3DAU5_9FLAO|nr:hypothetical protein [Zunongwangia sp. F117]MDT0678655.1 hypothetical protein [Zunongwangia sp. F117]